MRTKMQNTVFAAAMAVAISACTVDVGTNPGSDAEPERPVTASMEARAPEAPAAESKASTETAAAKPEVETPAAAPKAEAASTALATAEGSQPGMRLEVTELKRSSGDTVTLKFTMHADEPIAFGYNFGDSNFQIKDHGSVGGVHLTDPEGKKKYLVIRDQEKNCICSRGLRDSKAVNAWAKFPAPPPDVDTISVVVPGFSPMDDVPISG